MRIIETLEEPKHATQPTSTRLSNGDGSFVVVTANVSGDAWCAIVADDD